MSPPADIEALAKEILVNTTSFPPFMFLESVSLFDDLCTAYDRRKARPEVYETLLDPPPADPACCHPPKS